MASVTNIEYPNRDRLIEIDRHVLVVGVSNVRNVTSCVWKCSIGSPLPCTVPVSRTTPTAWRLPRIGGGQHASRR